MHETNRTFDAQYKKDIASRSSTASDLGFGGHSAAVYRYLRERHADQAEEIARLCIEAGTDREDAPADATLSIGPDGLKLELSYSAPTHPLAGGGEV